MLPNRCTLPAADACLIWECVYGHEYYGMQMQPGDVLRVWFHDERPAKLAIQMLKLWPSAHSITIYWGDDMYETVTNDRRTGVDYVFTLAQVDDMMQASLV